jgi:integrase
MKLTEKQISAAKPKAKTYRLADGRGMYLEVSPAGGKWWRMKYRFAGQEKRLGLGTYPAVSLKKARSLLEDQRKTLEAGGDPGAMRKAEKLARKAAVQNTLECVARGWLDHREDLWKPNTRAMIKASLENDLFPKLGNLPAADITSAHIRDLVQGIERRGAAETASRVFQRLRSIFRYAVANDIVTTDPTYPLKPSEILRPRRVKHRAAMPKREVPAFFVKLDAYEGHPPITQALHFLVLTAVRPGELRGARWDEIDADNAMWRIPAARMKMGKEHLVPLSKQALAVLDELRPLSGHRKLVFPSPFYPGKPLSENTLNSALARMGYKGMATAHGFRALFNTSATEAGFNADMVDRQLAHEEHDEVRAAYNRAEYLAERVKLMAWWGNEVDEMRRGAEIIPLRA